jgi:hypothetical protein
MQAQTFLNAYLTDLELAVWRGFFRVHSGLVRELDRELETKHGLPLTSSRFSSTSRRHPTDGCA